MRSTRDVHKSGLGGTTQVLQDVRRIFKESDRIHACPTVATSQQREERTNQPYGAFAIDTEYSDWEYKYSVTTPLIYPEDLHNE